MHWGCLCSCPLRHPSLQGWISRQPEGNPALLPTPRAPFEGQGGLSTPQVEGWVLCSPCRHQHTVWGSDTSFPCWFFPNLTLACVCVTAAQRRNGAAERQRAAELRAAGSAPLEFTVLLHSFHVWSSDKQLGRKANRGKRWDFLAG